jgi:hypothetical protein
MLDAMLRLAPRGEIAFPMAGIVFAGLKKSSDAQPVSDPGRILAKGHLAALP